MGGRSQYDLSRTRDRRLFAHLALPRVGNTEVLESEPAAPCLDPAARSLRVLYADDHEVNRQMVTMILEPLGIDLTLVENGR